MTDASRGVTCGMVSICTERSRTIAAMSAERRALAIGLSFRSTTSNRAEAWSLAAASTIASMFVPFGGSSSTETTHSPASSRRSRSVRSRVGAGRAATSRSITNSRDARLASLLDSRPNSRDLRRRRPAAPADELAPGCAPGRRTRRSSRESRAGTRCAHRCGSAGRRSAGRSVAVRWRLRSSRRARPGPPAARGRSSPRPQRPRAGRAGRRHRAPGPPPESRPSSSKVSWATIGSEETACTARIAVSSSSRS